MEKENEMSLAVIENSATSLKPYHDIHMEWAILKEQAKMLVKSGMLPVSVRTPEAALAIMMTGKEYGIGIMRSFQNIYFIKGTLSMAPKMKYALARKSGMLAKFNIKEGDDWAEATAQRKDDGQTFVVKYTMEMARKAGLAGKDNWKSFPQNMLRWRAIGYVLELAVPEIVGGLYSPDELGVPVDAEGNLVIGAAIVDEADPSHGSGVNVNPNVKEKEAPKTVDVTKFVAENNKMTEIKELWKVTKGMGVSEAEFREFVKTKWNKDSTKDLTDDQIGEWKDLVNTCSSRDDFLGIQKAEEVIIAEVSEVNEAQASAPDDDSGLAYDPETGEVVYTTPAQAAKPVEAKPAETKPPINPGNTVAQPGQKMSFPNI